MQVTVRHVGKLPYARRLTPSSLSSSSSLTQQSTGNNHHHHHHINNAQDTSNHNFQALFTNAALLTDPAEEEIDRLTREAMLEQTGGLGLASEEYYMSTAESGIESMPYESYMLDLELDEEVLRLKQKMKEKRELIQFDRPLMTTGLVRFVHVFWSSFLNLCKNRRPIESIMKQ